MTKIKIAHPCCICGKDYGLHGNNPSPIYSAPSVYELARAIVGSIGAELIRRRAPQDTLDIFFDIANKELDNIKNAKNG